MRVIESFRAPRLGRTVAALVGGAILAGAIAACGESSTVSDASPTPEPTEVVAQLLATVPPGRTAGPAGASPAARTPEAMTTVAPTTPVVVETPTEAAADTPAPTTAPTEGAGDGIEAGRQLFTSSGCAACHGIDLSGGIGPALAGRTPDNLTEDRIRTQIADGGNGMPPFASLTTEQVDELIALIRAS